MYSQDHNEVIQMLSEQYPRCFFEEPRLRQPLKKNIIADIDPTKFPAGIDFAGAINWYCGHYGYLKCVSVPGVRRLDVDGNAVDTVTQKEAKAAVDRINEINAEKAARGLADPHQQPWRAAVPNRANGIPIAKLVAPPPSPLTDAELTATAARKLSRVQSILEAGDEDGLMSVTARPLLKMVMDDVQALVARLDRAAR